ncbi:MAG: sensor histidine kinase [Candidatus Methanospirareceae archaeon]
MKRKMSEREKEEKEDYFLKILDIIEETVFVIDRDLRILYLSRGCLNKFREGVEREIAIGKRCYEGLWGLEEVCEGCPVSSVFENGEAARTERVFSLPDGTNRYFDIEWLPVLDEQGEVTRVIGDIRDITKRKEAEEQSRAIFEHVLTPLCLIAEDGRISRVNKEFETLSGYSREEAVGKKWTEFVAPEDLERVMSFYHRRKKGESPCCDFKFVTQGGGVKDVKVCIEDILNGRLKVASLTDLTKMKREEELSAICEELKELDNMKRNFLNAAYHELRSPLTPIVGYASLLKCDKLSDKQKEYLHNIEKYAEQLKEQINRMLELARIDGGKIEIGMEEVSIPEIVNGVVKSFKPLWNDKDQTITVHVPEGIEVRGDKQKITAIFTNLVSNAIKYTNEGGRIDIMVEDRGEDIRVCVSDTGIGIPEKHLPKIFERFYMVNTSLTRKSESLGLGLAIVKEYVKLHGGRIWATSKPGKGSKFFFTLPKRGKAR